MAKQMGRPKSKIEREQFEKLCNIQCTLEEIAGFFDCCDDTINNWCKKEYGETFSEVYKKKSIVGKISLRRLQFQLAEKNAPLCIWLGKQYLGQRDIKETEEETEHEINITMSMPKEEDIERVKRLKEQLFKNDKN